MDLVLSSLFVCCEKKIFELKRLINEQINGNVQILGRKSLAIRNFIW